MLIYIFVEHYPTPYKPYFDTQFACLIRKGHTIRIFAYGKYTDTINKEVRLFQLDKKTFYYPTTLKTLPRFVPSLLLFCIRHPIAGVKYSLSILAEKRPLKQSIMMIARTLLLPSEIPDVCLIHNLSTATSFTFLSERYPKTMALMYFHGGEIPHMPRIQDGQYAFKKMSFVFTNTEFSRQQAIQRGCDAKKIEISPVGFHIPDYFDNGLKEYRCGGVLRLISVGRLGEEKGIIYALKAIKALLEEGVTQLMYKIVGSGYLLSLLQDYVIKNGLTEHVIFVGEKSKDDVILELNESDVLLLPSLVTDTWSETQACVVQEAMLMRLIVITTNAGGVPESIPDEMRRFSVNCRNANELTDKISDILSLTDIEMHKYGVAGRSFVVNGYGIESVTDKILKKLKLFKLKNNSKGKEITRT